MLMAPWMVSSTMVSRFTGLYVAFSDTSNISDQYGPGRGAASSGALPSPWRSVGSSTSSAGTFFFA